MANEVSRRGAGPIFTLPTRRRGVRDVLLFVLSGLIGLALGAVGSAAADSGDSQTSTEAMATSADKTEASPPDNLLELAQGGIIVTASANGYDALSLTDGAPATSWHNEGKRDGLPYSFVLELRAPTMLSAVGVTGGGPRPGGTPSASVKDVTFEASSQGPDQGFEEIATFEAAETGDTIKPLEGRAPVRWLRLTVHSNYGNPIWTYFNSIIAYGTQAPQAPVDFSGTYKTGRNDFTRLEQTGSTISGCYTEQGGNTRGEIAGAVENGAAHVRWTSDRGVAGTAFFLIDSGGKLNGVGYRDRSRYPWIGDKAEAPASSACAPAPENPVAAALENDGRAVVYGILFDFDKATLRPQSTPALEKLLAALQENQAIDVVIEGHTDAAGDDAYNLDLSTRRAQSVIDWLVARGIEKARLRASGKGETSPVASNETADGRALNRRVEVVRQ